MSGEVPIPTPIRRFIHLPNLAVYLRHGGMHSPNTMPANSGWIPTHSAKLQAMRGTTPIPCGPGGTIHDYVPFYFGTHTPMMLNLHTGRVSGYTNGQEALIYLVSTAQLVQESGLQFVFSDRHGYVAYAKWNDKIARLSGVDWNAVRSQYWGINNDPTGELQSKKQAEFLVHGFMPWSLIQEIAVYDARRRDQVYTILDAEGVRHRPPVIVRRDWYFAR